MGILDVLILLLVASWVGGFAAHVGGALIHMLLVIAAVMLCVRVISGRRAV